MITPVTTVLDQWNSDSDAVAAGLEETRRVLETAELFWICTVRADGRPHATPLVAVWLDDALHFHTGSEEQKFANLRANPHVVLTTGCNQFQRLTATLTATAAANGKVSLSGKQHPRTLARHAATGDMSGLKSRRS